MGSSMGQVDHGQRNGKAKSTAQRGGGRERRGKAVASVPNTSQVAFPYEDYDAMDASLGDILRGERATAGKSLLDVERDLKIKASYIAAIENGDLSAFSSPGFIAGYVRSYARYLNLDPEWTFGRFQRESGFYGVHGFSAKQAEAAKRRLADAPSKRIDPNDVIKAARVNFAPEKERLLDRIEPATGPGRRCMSSSACNSPRSMKRRTRLPSLTRKRLSAAERRSWPMGRARWPPTRISTGSTGPKRCKRPR